MYAIDHVILAVADLDAAADRLFAEYGLASLVGGRHPGHGTGNRIVPLGPNYLELMAVVDPEEAAASPLGRWLTRNAGTDLRPSALCLRTDRITDIAAILCEDPQAMTRITPDGRTLAWSLAGLGAMLGPLTLPFFIEWQIAPDDHPARSDAPHTVHPEGIVAVAVGPVGEALAGVIAATPGVTAHDVSPGIESVTISTAEGPIVLTRT